MGILEETLKGRSLADYTNTQLRLALGAVLYTNTADMWKKYLNQLGYVGDVAQMLQKYYVDYNVPQQFRNYINAGASIFNPQNLFAADSPGYLYDLDDLSTLFLDSAGTTSATVNGLVGLKLDKSKGLALGAELVDTLDSASEWVKVGNNVVTQDGSEIRIDFVDNATGSQTTLGLVGGLSQNLVVGKWYKISCFARVNSGSSVNLSIEDGGGNKVIYSVTSTALTQYTFYALYDGFLRLKQNGMSVGESVWISGHSVKELPGNHAYQSTTGSKPILRGTPTGANLVTNGGFAADTDWTKGTGWTISGGTANYTGGGAVQGLNQNYSFTAGKVYRLTYTVSSVSAGTVFTRIVGGSNIDGPTRSANGTYVEYFTAITGSATLSFRGSATGSLSIDNIELVDVSAGQVTAPYALQYDGVDDFLQTASVNFTATDKVTVCHGVRKLSDAATAVIVELSATSLSVGSFGLFAPSAAANNYGWRCHGSIIGGVIATTGYTAPALNVIGGIGDIATDTCQLRVNGAQVNSTSADQGTGNYQNAALYFGRRAGTSLPYNGLMYSSVCIGRLLTAAELANVERWVARKTGLTL